MFIVLKNWDGRDLGINADGTMESDLNRAELFASAREADRVAGKFGGRALAEWRIFGDPTTDDDKD